MKLHQLVCIVLVVFIISYLIFFHYYGTVHTPTDYTYIKQPKNTGKLYHTIKDFKQYYSDCSKIDSFTFANDQVNKLREDCYNKNFDKKYYLNKKETLKIDLEKSELLSKHNFIQDKGLVRMRNKYKSNSDIDRSLTSKVYVIDDYYCPSGGVKEWTTLDNNVKWFGIYIKSVNNGDSWFNHLNNETKNVHRLKMNEDAFILVHIARALETTPDQPFWYSVDSKSGARVLEFSLDDETAKSIRESRE